MKIIFRDLLKYRRFPPGLFVGESGRLQALKTIVMNRR
jgi:hypothetical protein